MSEPDRGLLIGGKYRLLRQLGAGGMGIVYEACNELTEKRVAIKRLRPELASRPELAQRMLREAQASARIRHPNVVDVLDLGTEGDTVFLVMEFLEGETLGARLSRGGLSIGGVLALLLPAMRGVAAGHALGIVHRDIKPENIFLARLPDQAQPVPKVLDFGISKLLHGDDPSLTESGITLGTPLYMSYEQLTGARDVDGRADVYAFGAILYEALTGRPPFEGETLGSLAVQVATSKPRRPSELSAGLPRALDHVLLHAVAGRREERFSSLDGFQQALAPFVTSTHVPTRGFSAVPRGVAETATLPAVQLLVADENALPRSRKLLMLGTLLSLVLGALLAVGWVLTAHDQKAAVKRPIEAPKSPAPPVAPSEPGNAGLDVAGQVHPDEPAAAPSGPDEPPVLAKPANRSTPPERARERRRPARQSTEPSAAAAAPAKISSPAAHEPPEAGPTPMAPPKTPATRHRAGTPKLDEF